MLHKHSAGIKASRDDTLVIHAVDTISEVEYG